jgi:glycosyltransferase involved in cell wall biosynthesis
MGNSDLSKQDEPKINEIAFVDMASQMSGVEFSTLYTAQHLDRRCWSPLVICPEEGDLPDHCRLVDVPVFILPIPRFASTGVHVAGKVIVNPFAVVLNVAYVFIAACKLARLFARRRPALVVTKGLLAHFYGGLAARWMRIPCVWHVQDRVSERAGRVFPWTLSIAGRLFARAIIADADSIARQLAPFVPPDRIFVIWNGVNINEFSPQVDGSHVRAEWGAGVSDLLIGNIGRLTFWKGQHILIRAFAQIADRFPLARIILIGAPLFDTSAYADSLREEIARLGLGRRIVFAGFRWDLPQVLAALDMVAHTAMEKDSSPLAVVSAMAAGKPVVCSSVDGTAQLFDDGVDGLLFPPHDVDGLAHKLSQLCADANLRGRLSLAARAKAERDLDAAQATLRCERIFLRALQP